MDSTRRGILISGLGAILPISLPTSIAAATSVTVKERRQAFNDAWRFFKEKPRAPNSRPSTIPGGRNFACRTIGRSKDRSIRS